MILTPFISLALFASTLFAAPIPPLKKYGPWVNHDGVDPIEVESSSGHSNRVHYKRTLEDRPLQPIATDVDHPFLSQSPSDQLVFVAAHTRNVMDRYDQVHRADAQIRLREAVVAPEEYVFDPTHDVNTERYQQILSTEANLVVQENRLTMNEGRLLHHIHNVVKKEEFLKVWDQSLVEAEMSSTVADTLLDERETTMQQKKDHPEVAQALITWDDVMTAAEGRNTKTLDMHIDRWVKHKVSN